MYALDMRGEKKSKYLRARAEPTLVKEVSDAAGTYKVAGDQSDAVRRFIEIGVMTARVFDSADLYYLETKIMPKVKAIIEREAGPRTHHNFRDYFVTCALERGVSFPALAAWIGHQDQGILLSKTYAKLRKSHSDTEAEKMTAWATGMGKPVLAEVRKAANQ